MPNPEDSNNAPKKESKWPASALLTVPFFFVLVPLYKAAKEELAWRGLLLTIFVFEIGMFFTERFSISREHWIYHDAKLLGPKIDGVPIEEPFIYYWLSPVVVILLFLAIRRHLEKRAKR